MISLLCMATAAQYVGRASDIGSTTQIEVPLRSGRAAVAATLIHFRCGMLCEHGIRLCRCGPYSACAFTYQG